MSLLDIFKKLLGKREEIEEPVVIENPSEIKWTDPNKERAAIREQEAKENLRMLAYFSSGRCGTDGYDDYHTLVLYQVDDEYQLRTYDGDDYSEKRKIYTVDKEFVDEVFQTIKDLKLASYENKNGEPVDGGFASGRFLVNERIVALNLGNFTSEKSSLLYELKKVLVKGMDENRRMD